MCKAFIEKITTYYFKKNVELEYVMNWLTQHCKNASYPKIYKFNAMEIKSTRGLSLIFPFVGT